MREEESISHRLGYCWKRYTSTEKQQKGEGKIPTQMKEDKSLLWSMSHHLEAAMALINMGLVNDLLDVEM